MDISGNTILITGGSSGIGFALAQAFCQNGNEVIAVGRNAEKLARAKEECPALHTIQADISKEPEIQRLIETVQTNFPNINMLVNNAAAGNFLDLTHESDACARAREEMETNYLAPMRIITMLMETLKQQPEAAIVNITTIGVYLPVAKMPGYSASKAALHSYTQSLRWQLANSTIEVFEVIPPAVDTDFVATFQMPKMTAESVAQKVIKGLKKGETDIFIGAARILRRLSRLAPNTMERLSHVQTEKALEKK